MMKRYMQGELAPDTPKEAIEPMAIDPNSKVMQGATSGDGNDKKGQSKSKVDPAIFRMAEERDSDKKSKKNYANVDKFQKVAKVIKKPMQFYLSNIKRDAFSKAIKSSKGFKAGAMAGRKKATDFK